MINRQNISIGTIFAFLMVILVFGYKAVCSEVASPYLPTDSVREKILLDFDWRFAFGHPSDTAKDFNHATEMFSYFAKTGNGDGAAAADFDDSGWRKLDLPHDCSK